MLIGCNKPKEPVVTTYLNSTPNSIYGQLSNFSFDVDEAAPGKTLTFTVTPAEDFFIDTVTNNGVKCTPISRNADGSFVYSTVLQEGQNKLKATYNVDPTIDFVDKFKLNIPDDVFAEVMNPTAYTQDKKLGLDFRRSGIEQVNAPMKWSGGKKVADTSVFMNYVDGDTTHVEAKNLGYTIKIKEITMNMATIEITKI